MAQRSTWWLAVMLLVGTMLSCNASDPELELARATQGLTGDTRACLLEYNTALVADGEDPCCRREGGVNQCNTETSCNERSGGSCCIIYATQHTRGGQGCCMYEGGGFGTTGAGANREQECRELLQME
ncbi:MAG: hypothetical protein AB2A00_23380 [Myxococcota bacterium]